MASAALVLLWHADIDTRGWLLESMPSSIHAKLGYVLCGMV